MNIQQILTNSRASQNKEELGVLLAYLQEAPRKVILEIGVDRGYSLEVWRWAVEPDLLIGIEPNVSNISLDVVGDAIIIPKQSDDPKIMESLEVALGGRGIDFLFIDGDHHYDLVKHDFQLFSPLVNKGGIIAFHDIGLHDHPDVEVYKYWDEIKSNYNYREHVLGGTGVGIIFV